MVKYGSTQSTRDSDSEQAGLNKSNLKCCGEYLYLTNIRPKLVSTGYLSPITNNVSLASNSNNKQKTISKSDQIKTKNVNQSINHELSDLLESLLNATFSQNCDFKSQIDKYQFGYKSNTIDFRLITLLILCINQMKFSQLSNTDNNLYQKSITKPSKRLFIHWKLSIRTCLLTLLIQLN